MRLNRKEFLKLVGHGTAASVAVASVGGAMPAEGQTVPGGKPKKEVRGNAIKGTTDAVRRFIATSSLRQMPPNVVAEGKRCLIDNIGVLLAGSTAEGSHILRQYAQKSSGAKEATVLGREPIVVSAAHAALANAGSAHALDYDDTQLSSTPDRTFGLLTHPTTPALSAALAVAERSGASGAAFLEAYLTGVEVECKMAEAIDPNHYERGFHSTGTLGVFGAAAAAGKLIKLNDAQLAHMLAIASSLSAGIRVNFGSMSKPLNAARASENGVFAAELASQGFTGGDDGLDGQWGFFQVLGDGADLDRLIGVLGQPWSIVTPGVSFKPYPCGSLSHPSMDAMMKVVKDHDLKPDQIRAVRLRAGNNILEPLRYGVAKNELEAKFSVPFLMSAVILTRRAGMREFTDEFVASPAAQQMMQRVTGVHDLEIEKQGFDKIRSVVEVDLVDGRRLVQPSDDRYRGGPDNPFTRADLKAKFDDCASLVLAQDRLGPAFNAIESVDSMPDIRQLVRILSSRTRFLAVVVAMWAFGFGSPIAAQSAYVAGTIGADVSRVSHTTSSAYSPPSSDSEVFSGSLRVGTSVGPGWGVELEFVRANRSRGPSPNLVSPLFDPLTYTVTPGTPAFVSSISPVPNIALFSTDVRVNHADFDALAWARQRAGDSVDLVYLGGVAFSRRRTDITQTFPTSLRGLVPNGGFHTTFVDYGTRPLVGAEARIRLASHMRLIPGLRVQGLGDGWLLRPYVGLGWFF